MNELKTILSQCKKHGMNETLLSLYEKHGMSETTKAYATIWLLHNDRLKLEKLPRTSKIEAKIEELRSKELQLKRAVTKPDFINRLKQSAEQKVKKIAEKYVQKQQQKRAMRQRWHGMIREEILERNQKIINEYHKPRKTPLTMASFAEKHAVKYGLKPRQIRYILSKAVGSLPG